MALMSPRKRPVEEELEADPREAQAWFRKLPARRREEEVRARRADLERGLELERRERRRGLHEALALGVLFLLGDLVCPLTSWGSAGLALPAGLAMGYVCHLLDAGRLTTGALGLASFFMLQWLTRGGLTGLHLFIFFPFGSLCAYLGYVREERGTL